MKPIEDLLVLLEYVPEKFVHHTSIAKSAGIEARSMSAILGIFKRFGLVENEVSIINGTAISKWKRKDLKQVQAQIVKIKQKYGGKK